MEANEEAKMQLNEQKKNYMEPDKEYNEINGYVIGWGFFYALIFTLSMEYLALKVGQTVDACMPVSILAMSMGILLKRLDPFPEAVHIQAIASSGTNVIVGAIFVLPAFFILRLPEMSFAALVIPLVLGSVIGVLIASIFRRYFCVEKDAEFPFPNGRAGASLLSTNDSAGGKLIAISGGIGLIYDYILDSLGLWSETVSTLAFGWGQTLMTKAKLHLSIGLDIAMLGIGYFTGIRYAAIIVAGTFMADLAITPLIYYIGADRQLMVNGEMVKLASVSADVIYSQITRQLGIGMMAMAGIIGLLSMGKAVVVIAKQTLNNLSGLTREQGHVIRTERDLPAGFICTGIVACCLLFGVYYQLFLSGSLLETFIVVPAVCICSILLSIVGISSVAFTGNEPVSGITLFLMLVMGAILNMLGVIGNQGTATLLILAAFGATVICLAGNFSTELKIAYLTGATPLVMEKWQIISNVAIAFVSVGALYLLNGVYGFGGESQLHAPQANAMAAVANSILGSGDAPWTLYMVGAVGAVVIWMLGVPALPFALGVYLPTEINLPILVGGLLSYFVGKSGDSPEECEANLGRGTTMAAGLVAGGAIGGLINALQQIAGINFFLTEWSKTPEAGGLGLLIYGAVVLLVYKMAKSK